MTTNTQTQNPQPAQNPQATSGQGELWAAQGELIPADGYRFMRDNHLMIIGCGSVGCQLADSLYRMGQWGRITLVDPARVTARNIATQSFAESEVGQPKVTALEARLRGIYRTAQTPIQTINSRWDVPNVGFAPVMFMAVDDISVRAAIIAALPPAVEFLGDIRMDKTIGQVLALTGNNGGREYVQQNMNMILFPPSEAEGTGCQTTSFNAVVKLLVGLQLDQQLRAFLNNQPVPRHIRYDHGCVLIEPAESIHFSRTSPPVAGNFSQRRQPAHA